MHIILLYESFVYARENYSLGVLLAVECGKLVFIMTRKIFIKMYIVLYFFHQL